MICRAMCRPRLLTQTEIFWPRLFDNLIGNAIKYGADGKRVLVQIHAEGETVTVSVTNYGYVIPADELPLIFNKFYRVEQSRSSSTGGTGLGSCHCKGDRGYAWRYDQRSQ